ncbi:MAG: hypothetical protein ACRYFU_10840 [Janthinobacterium lividum]
MPVAPKEYIKIRASEILGQHELIELLNARFPELATRVGDLGFPGTGVIEARVPLDSPKLQEIRDLIAAKRKQGVPEYAVLAIGEYVRSYTVAELRNAEALLLKIAAYCEHAGEQCGTVYETLCPHCNLGRQMSDLILNPRRMPKRKDIAETIAWVEWVVSSRFVHAFTENHLSGAEFRPIVDFKKAAMHSQEWHQLQVFGKAGAIAEKTVIGKDPFSPSEVSWRCPMGHSVVAQCLSEVYLNRDAWDGSDIAVTSSLFGQGRGFLRPFPLIVISQRMYRLLQEEGLKGYTVRIAHMI